MTKLYYISTLIKKAFQFGAQACNPYNMKHLPLDLLGLAPKEATFTLSETTGPLTLSKWSLRVRAWAFAKYGAERLKEIFETQDMVAISELAFFMLKEKDGFATLEDFQDAIITMQDQVNVVTALLATVGIGEPEIEKIDQSLKKEAASPNGPSPKTRQKRKTGAKSTTPSPGDTPG